MDSVFFFNDPKHWAGLPTPTHEYKARCKNTHSPAGGSYISSTKFFIINLLILEIRTDDFPPFDLLPPSSNSTSLTPAAAIATIGAQFRSRRRELLAATPSPELVPPCAAFLRLRAP